jgi:hypothetical protein
MKINSKQALDLAFEILGVAIALVATNVLLPLADAEDYTHPRYVASVSTIEWREEDGGC